MFIPLSNLKNTAKIVKLCEDFDEPMSVTRNGYPELVIMSAAFFKENRYRGTDGNLDKERELLNVPPPIPIKTLKKTSDVSRICLEEQPPVSIIRNGYDVLVIMSMSVYKQRVDQKQNF